QLSKERCAVEQPASHDVHDALLSLQFAMDFEQSRLHQGAAVLIPDPFPYDDVHLSCLVLQRKECHAARGTRALTHKNDTCRAYWLTVRHAFKITRADQLIGSQRVAQQCQWMAPQGEAYGSIVSDDTFPFRGSPQERRGLMSLLRRIDQSLFQRQRPLRPRDLPESQMTIAAQRGKSAGGSQRLEVAAIERRANSEVLYACERLLPASLDEAVRAALRKRFDQPQAQTQHRFSIFSPLQRAIPHAHANVDRPHLHAMRPRIPNELRRCIETHRLAIEQRRRESRRLVTFEPRGIVCQQGKAGRM